MNNQTINSRSVGREKAIQLLEAQLVRGTKPAKIKYTKAYGSRRTDSRIIRTLEYPAEHSGDYIPLTVVDIDRIKEQIHNLKVKKTRWESRQTASPAILHTDQFDINLTPIYKEVRIKNPKTKLYKFINGVYQKITGK